MNAREYLEILHVAERLKDTPRHCTTSQGRIESVAEHKSSRYVSDPSWKHGII